MAWGRTKQKPKAKSGSFRLDHTLLQLSRRDTWTIGDACEGTQVFGATGSGKTSGSGAAIARAMLSAGFGGLVLTAKPDERDTWERYCQQTGRTDSLLVVDVSGAQRFNFLDYEVRRPGGGITGNIVDLFTVVLRALHGAGGTSNEAYWERAQEQLLRNAIDLLRMSTGNVTLPDLVQVIRTGPQDRDALEDESWRQTSFCAARMSEALAKAGTSQSGQMGADLRETLAYWTVEYPGLADRTRSSIVSTFTTAADGLLREPMRSLFCTDSTVVPELTHEGVVLVIDLPTKSHHLVGRFAQLIWKTMWQRATEQRTVEPETRPVFLWADESQEFATARDAQFQATARSSKACTVYLTQNLSNYLAAMGQEGNAQAAADSLLGNFQTKIFHANGDSVTNEWASKTIANDWSWRTSTNSTPEADKSGRRHNKTTASAQQSFDAQVPPIAFTQLRKGGHANKRRVDGIVFQGGRVWNATGKNHMQVTFKQA